MLKSITQASISYRLPAFISLALFLTIVTLNVISYNSMRHTIEEDAIRIADTIAETAQERLNDVVNEVAEEVSALADDLTVRDAIYRFGTNIITPAGGPIPSVVDAYLNDNPYPLGERAKLTNSERGMPYDLTHATFHEQFLRIAERSSYYDLFLIAPDGLIAYTVYKEGDFGQNLVTGRLATSGLGQAFDAAIASEGDAPVFIDATPYAPSAGAPASFVAQKIVGDDGDTLGVVAVQITTTDLTVRIADTKVLSEQDEIYFVGSDGLARSNAIHSDAVQILSPVPDLPQTQFAATGEAGSLIGVLGISGKKVLAFVRPFDLRGADWSVIIELDEAETFTQLTAMELQAVAFVLIGTMIASFVGWLVSQSITGPINKFADSMTKVADGDYDAEISGLGRYDEIGTLAQSLDSFRGTLIEARVLSEREEELRDEQVKVVENLGTGMKDLASGNLMVKLDDPFPQEYEQLRADFNATVETMNTLMQTIVSNAHEIRNRAEEISNSSDDLSQRTESQAAALEETAAALDEMTTSVKATAEGASEVENVVAVARRDAEQSGAVVAEAVDAMSLIRKSSSEISQIIGVIDDIAFQTNLLSLNAGVEAARAGDAGRGFAVVASEVRALAQRSSEAAKQIKTLITSSTEQVETGVGLVGRTGDALGSIVGHVGDIDKLVSGIATGAREQSAGLGEINVGISQLDQVTQQNAAMVEEATAAANTLKQESVSLTQIVSQFQIDDGDEVEESTAEVVSFRSGVPAASAPQAQASRPATRAQRVDMAANDTRWQDF